MEILPLTVCNHVFNQILFGFSRFNERALFVNRIIRITFRRLFFIDKGYQYLHARSKSERYQVFLSNEKIYTRISSNEILFTVSY